MFFVYLWFFLHLLSRRRRGDYCTELSQGAATRAEKHGFLRTEKSLAWWEVLHVKHGTMCAFGGSTRRGPSLYTRGVQ
jgi:hypothetical protein